MQIKTEGLRNLSFCLALAAGWIAGAGASRAAPVFAPPVDYAARSGICDVVSADVNNDGKTDLVTANGNDGQGGQNTVSVLLGNGDGTFQPPLDSSTLHAPARLRVGDFNHDGKPDAAIVSGQQFSTDSKYLDILLGNGDGTFQPPISYTVAGGPNNLTLSDVNQDGNPDVLTANYNSNSLNVLLGKGDGTFQSIISPSGSFRPTNIAVADYNNDGKLDLATSYRLAGKSVSIMLGKGDGTFLPATYLPGGDHLADVLSTDLNGDGNADLVTASTLLNEVNVLLGKGDGTFQAPLLMYSTGPGPLNVVSGDLDGDGKPDLAFGNSGFGSFTGIGSIGTMTGQGDGTFEAEIFCQPFEELGGTVTLGDFNGDGRPDLAGVHRTSTVAVLLNQTPLLPPSPPVNFSLTYYPPGGADRIGIGDYNNDSKADIVLYKSIFYGNGDGTFQPLASFSVDPPQITEATADFNDDGILDRARVEAACHAVSIALGNGSGGYRPDVHLFEAGSHPVALAVGDLNGDGKPDIAVADYGYPNPAEGNQSITVGKTTAVLLNTSGAGELHVTAAPATVHEEQSVQLTVSSQNPLSGPPSVSVSGPCISTASVPMTATGSPNTYSGSYVVPAGSTDCTVLVVAQGTPSGGGPAIKGRTIFQIDRNAVPVADDQSFTLFEGRSISFTLSASDPDQTSLTYIFVTPPAHGALIGTFPHLTYTPDPGFSGVDAFTYRVSDGTDVSRTATVSFVVKHPLFIIGSATVAPGESATVTIDATDAVSDLAGLDLNIQRIDSSSFHISPVFELGNATADWQLFFPDSSLWHVALLDSAHSVSGPANLLRLKLTVALDMPVGITFPLTPLSATMTTESGQDQTVTSDVRPGSLTVVACRERAKGDVNGDGTLGVGDVILALRIFVNLTAGNACMKAAADVDCNGSVGLGDALKILQAVSLNHPIQACQ
jgi:hypothetical protein